MRIILAYLYNFLSHYPIAITLKFISIFSIKKLSISIIHVNNFI